MSVKQQGLHKYLFRQIFKSQLYKNVQLLTDCKEFQINLIFATETSVFDFDSGEFIK